MKRVWIQAQRSTDQLHSETNAKLEKLEAEGCRIESVQLAADPEFTTVMIVFERVEVVEE